MLQFQVTHQSYIFRLMASLHRTFSGYWLPLIVHFQVNGIPPLYIFRSWPVSYCEISHNYGFYPITGEKPAHTHNDLIKYGGSIKCCISIAYGGVIIVRNQMILLRTEPLKCKGIFEDITVVNRVTKRYSRVIRLFSE